VSEIQTISPVDNSIYCSRPANTGADIERALETARAAFLSWRQTPLEQRATMLTAFVEAILADGPATAEEISWQMGRPLSQTPGELAGFAERARHMIDIAPAALAEHRPDIIDGFDRWIQPRPLGVVAVLSPWNYPLLTSVNAIVPALMAGNVVILKPSHQTPLVAERYLRAAQKTLPDGVLQALFLDHKQTAAMLAQRNIDGVFFTGSVAGGVAVQQSLQHKFIPCGLELGGKDPAYVRADADLDYAVANLVDGAFFNSGQSCCGIERIYVHSDIYRRFVDAFVSTTGQYRLGNPLQTDTNLGPMVKTAAADFVRGQIHQAVAAGAKSLVPESLFPASRAGTPYLSPHVLVDVDHSMAVMRDESFGPVVGIMPVDSDAQAITLMNDSDYGLTASLWTEDAEAVRTLGQDIETGTVFMNRCDYLDPALAWTGVKSTGRGITLSQLGYEHMTRVKSWHLRLQH
jgi:acyl-CoA reductase-like NAD-dependent aldehyde dehydrogenase